jgi:hypothetical protein
MGEETFTRTSPALWLSLCVLMGIANMALGSAPWHYLAINAAALVAAIAVIRFSSTLQTERAAIILCAFAITALTMPLFVGPDLEGIRRWVGFGPLQLHSGMLILPMLAILLQRLKSIHAIVVTALAAIAISFQPDRASAIALFAGTGALLLTNRSAANVIQALCTCLAVAATFLQPDNLQPVAFVENILPSAWRYNPFVAVALAASLFTAIVIPTYDNRHLIPAATTLSGFVLASMIGAYPVPLIGYGAAAIIGFGLAVAVARHPVQ